MNKLLVRIWSWVCRHDKLRHCICIFFLDQDSEWDGNTIGEDLQRYWKYTDDPEHADSELREFALNMENEIKLDNKIRMIRFIMGWVALAVGIMLIPLLTRFLLYVTEMVQKLMI